MDADLLRNQKHYNLHSDTHYMLDILGFKNCRMGHAAKLQLSAS